MWDEKKGRCAYPGCKGINKTKCTQYNTGLPIHVPRCLQATNSENHVGVGYHVDSCFIFKLAHL